MDDPLEADSHCLYIATRHVTVLAIKLQSAAKLLIVPSKLVTTHFNMMIYYYTLSENHT